MIRCLIVDDEPIAIRVVASHLEHVPDAEIAATSLNAADALKVLRSEPIDLVFLDIDMPQLTGIDLIESLSRPPAIIFTTAHRDYAVRGFELDAVDYLLKPIGFPRLNRAVEKYRRLQSAEHGEGRRAPDEAGFINVQVDRRTVRIGLDDVSYVESQSDHVIFHTATGSITTKFRISDLEEELAPHGFVRIHRSFLVPIRRVEAFTSTSVQVGPDTLPVSRTYRRGVGELLRR